MAMAALTPADYCAGGQVQSGKQSRRAMANVVVGHAIDIAQPHRQQGLGTFPGLNLAFFNAQRHGFIRRIQIQSHDIAHLFHKEGIGGEMKMRLPVRLETKRASDAVNRGLGEARLRGQRTATPVRGVVGSGPQRLANQHGDSLVADRARAARTQLPVQPCRPR